jgi:hypothetical protein
MLKLTALLLFACRLSLACSCGPTTPICSRIDSIGVFFLGDLISSNDDGTGTFAQSTLEHFKVIEIFKGLPEDATEVWVDPGSMTSCYSPHQAGTRYLIAAFRVVTSPDLENRSVNYRGEKKPLPQGFDPKTSLVVMSGGCLSSAIAAKSGEDIAFLRAWRKGASTSRILGQLNETEASPGNVRFPLRDAIVTITSPGFEWKGSTDADGKFELVGVAPGSYQVRFDHRDYGRYIPNEPIDVPKGGCGWVESFVQTTAQLRILVKNGSGAPVPNVLVEIFFQGDGKPDRPFWAHDSDSSGIVNFSGLPSGTYLIAVNRDGPSSAKQPYPPAYYPGTPLERETTLITLSPNEKRLDLSLRLPNPLPMRKIHVQVFYTDGNPVSGATVFSKSSASVQHTDDRGNATLDVLEGVEESVQAWKEFDTGEGGKPWVDWKRWRAEVKLEPGTEDSNVKVVFREWKRNRDWKP